MTIQDDRRRLPARRGAWVLAVALALCAAGVLFWRLAGAERQGSPPDSRAVPEASATEVGGAESSTPASVGAESSATELEHASEPAEPAQRLEVSPLAASVPEVPCHLTVVVLAPSVSGDPDAEQPPGFRGSAIVKMRRSAGGFERNFELTATKPSAEVECPPGEYEFTLRHRGPEPLGAQPIRTVLEADTKTNVTLALVPLLPLTGKVSDENGVALGGIALALERRGRSVGEAKTGADGDFAFSPLPLGEYELVVGDPLAPIVPRRTLDLAQWLGLMPVVVPRLFELEVRVLDAGGRAVAGARIEGNGDSGGRVTGETGRSGNLTARFLPPGNYQLSARHATLGQGQAQVELSGERREALEIHLSSDDAEDRPHER